MSVSRGNAPSAVGDTRTVRATLKRGGGSNSRLRSASFAQERIWFLQQVDPKVPFYNASQGLLLKGSVDAAVLRESIDEVITRHEALRTTFVFARGRVMCAVHPRLKPTFDDVDLSGLNKTDGWRAAQRLLTDLAQRPFDLEKGPLVRIALLHLADSETVFHVTTHHIILDAWSHALVLRELDGAYRSIVAGRGCQLPPAPAQYADYVNWQRKTLRKAVLETLLGYWRERLGTAPALLSLPTDHARPATQSHRGGTCQFQVPRHVVESLRTLCMRERVTLFTLLLSAFKVLLHRYSECADVLVGTPVSNRKSIEFESAVGLFINTVVLRTSLAGNPKFRDVLFSVRDALTEAHAHQDLPFETLVADLQIERDLSYNPVFQVLFTMDHESIGEEIFEKPVVRRVGVDKGTARFDLTMSVLYGSDTLEAALEYSTDLFEPATIARMAAHYENILLGIVAQPDRRIWDIPMLSESERQLYLAQPTADHTAGIAPSLLHELFETQASVHPSAIAAECGTEKVTYGELRTRVENLARALIECGVRPGECVALLVRRSIEMVVAMLALVKAGATYVPLEPHSPPARLRDIFRGCRAARILHDEFHTDLVRELSQTEARSEQVDRFVVTLAGNRPCPHSGPLTRATDDSRNPFVLAQVAYTMFTSGSTGVPKGVVVSHAAAANTIQWLNAECQVGPGDVLLGTVSIGFDLSVFDVFGILASGATLRIALDDEIQEPSKLARYLVDGTVTIWHSPPAMLEQVLECTPKSQHARLRIVMLGGDWIPLSMPDQIRELFPRAKIIALGGATEDAIWSNYYWVDRVDGSWTSIPYGRAIPPARCYILDRFLNLCPVGIPGELCVAGPGLASGYLHAPGLTAEKFLPDPYADSPGAVMHATGDRARIWHDGTIEFLGRVDHQVKVRGYRVEVGEIEAALYRHPAVDQAVVLLAGPHQSKKELVAYISPSVGAAGPLRRLLDAELLEPSRSAKFLELPNGLTAAQCNSRETSYLYHRIFEERVYEASLNDLPKEPVVVDVGCQVGLFALQVGFERPGARIIGLEPVPILAECARANARLCGIDLVLVEAAAGEASCKKQWTCHAFVPTFTGPYADASRDRCTAESHLDNETISEEGVQSGLQSSTVNGSDEPTRQTESFPCQVETLSKIYEDFQLERVDLLRINARKCELDILRGMNAWAWGVTKLVVIDVDDNKSRRALVRTRLQENGFSVSVVPTESGHCLISGVSADHARQRVFSKQLHAALPYCGRLFLRRVLTDHLRGLLPNYMIPSKWCFLNDMPMNANGKVDRPTLSSVLPRDENATRVHPRNQLEDAVLKIWKEVLEVPTIGVKDNFFEIGGHSLSAVKVISRIRRALDIELPLKSFFEYPTIAELAVLAQRVAVENKPLNIESPSPSAGTTARELLRQFEELDDAQVAAELEHLEGDAGDR